MDNSNAEKPSDEPEAFSEEESSTYHGFKSPIKKFIFAWYLGITILFGVVENFVEVLNERGVLKLGSNFSGDQIIWGESLLPNIAHILILSFFSGIFGALYGYFSVRAIGQIEKFFTGAIFAFLLLFGWPLAQAFAPAVTQGVTLEVIQAMNFLFLTFKENIFYSSITLSSLLATYISSTFFMNYGNKLRTHPDYLLDKDRPGTFFDINWYHYIWLIFPLDWYFKAFLNAIYGTFKSFFYFVNNFHWLDIFGVVIVQSGEPARRNTIDVLLGELFGAYALAALGILGLFVLQGLLSGRISVSRRANILLLILCGAILPILIASFSWGFHF